MLLETAQHTQIAIPSVVYDLAQRFKNDGRVVKDFIPEIDPDFLPGVSVTEERKLLNDAFVVTEALKKYDKLNRIDLASPDHNIRGNAERHQIEIEQKVATFLAEIHVANVLLRDSTKLPIVSGRIAEADRRKKSGESMIDTVKRRISVFPNGVQFLTDCDLTVTTKADYLQMIPGSIFAENYMAHPDHGRESFPYVFVRYWQEAMNVLEDNFNFIGRKVELRNGVIELLEKTKKQDIPVRIVSANFRPFIDGVIESLPDNSITSSFAVESRSILATDKSAIIRLQADDDPDRGIIYFGDGSSDAPAADELASQHVICYFALEGGSFAKLLQERNLPYFTYKDMHDTTAVLKELGVLS